MLETTDHMQLGSETMATRKKGSTRGRTARRSSASGRGAGPKVRAKSGRRAAASKKSAAARARSANGARASSAHTTRKTETASRNRRSTRRSGDEVASLDAISLLKRDHREVEKLARQFEQAEQDAEKGDIAQQICLALTVHAQIEEELFYPASREVLSEDNQKLIDEAEVEHATVKDLIAQIESMQPGQELYDAKVMVLTEYVKHHVKEEEGEYFPKVSKKLDLTSLGEALMRRKMELMDDMGEGRGPVPMEAAELRSHH